MRLSPPDSIRSSSRSGTRSHSSLDRVEVGRRRRRGWRCAGSSRSPPPRSARRQHALTEQRLGVLPGVDVVGDHRRLVAARQGAAQRRHQRRLAGADRTADAHPQRSVGAPSRGKQTHLPTGVVLGRAVRRAVPTTAGPSAPAVAGGRRALGGNRLGQSGQPHGHGHGVGGVDGQQPDRGRDGARHQVVHRQPGGVVWARPGGAGRPRRRRPDGARPGPPRHRAGKLRGRGPA